MLEEMAFPWQLSAERIGEIAALVERVTFPGYRFHLVGKDFLALCATFCASCNVHGGAPVEQFTRMWILEANATDEQIVQTCLKLVLTSVEHEARERFRFDGLAIYGPHMRLQDLMTAAQRVDKP